jgi:hypothetical protein
MSEKIRFRIIVLALAAAGIAITIYKHVKYDFPFLPTQERNVWTVEAKITFEPTNEPITVSLAVPDEQRTLTLLQESYISSGYNFVRDDEDKLHHRVIWTKPKATEMQTLYYRVDVAETSANQSILALPEELHLPESSWIAEQQATAEKLLSNIETLNDKPQTFIQAVVELLNQESVKEDVNLLTDSDTTILAKAKLAQRLLLMKDIPVQIGRGFELTEGESHRLSLHTFLGYFDPKTKKWDTYSFDNPNIENPDTFLVWQRGGLSLLEVSGGTNVKLKFTSIVNAQKAYQLAKHIALGKGGWLFDFSIYSLPIEQQATFKMLFLVPIGALIVVIMRSLIGIKTSGTFMPILIAMAFVSTRLGPGLVLFVIIVGAGLTIRYYLSSLNLLLVPRISAVLVVVLILMAAMSIISYKLGLQQGLRATLFPMIILAWTVERLSITWEEEGPREVFVQTSGSLIVALIAFFVMSSRLVSHVMFWFPELLLTLLAIIMLMGQYTGYRVLELIRFKPFTKGGA